MTNNTLSIEYNKLDLKWNKIPQKITLTLLILTSTIATIALVVLSASPVIIGGGIVITAISFGLTINFFIKSHFFVNQPASTPISKDRAQVIPVSESSSLPHSTTASVPSTPLKIVPPKIHFKGSIDLYSTQSGRIGKPSQQQLMCQYLKKICAEDGSPLLMKEDDVLLEFKIFNCSYKELDNAKIWLPAKLFLEKEYADFVRFQYDGKITELKIVKMHAWGSFNESLQALISNARDIPIFGIHDGNDWYSLGEKGSIYKLDTASNSTRNATQARKVEAHHFRQMTSPTEAKGDIVLNHGEAIFIVELPGFSLSDLDVIINEKSFILYGISEYLDIKRERFFRFDWKASSAFNSYTLEEMKIKILNAPFFISNGQLKFSVYL